VQSVHNALAALTEAGLLRRIEPAGSAALYELHENDNHHHLVCNRCRTVVDVECAVGHSPCLSPADSSGFQISTAEVTFWGLCQDCARLDPIHSSTPIRSLSTNQEDS
jgi:Fur family ferric uptake transcriptional regulator